MDVIFAAINKFLRFLSGFSHTHRFCYQPVNLWLRHYEIRFPWMKCCPNREKITLQRNCSISKFCLPFYSKQNIIFPSACVQDFLPGCLLGVGQEKQIVSSAGISSNSREDLTVGRLGFEKSEVQQVIWSPCCFLLFWWDICSNSSLSELSPCATA